MFEEERARDRGGYVLFLIFVRVDPFDLISFIGIEGIGVVISKSSVLVFEVFSSVGSEMSSDHPLEYEFDKVSEHVRLVAADLRGDVCAERAQRAVLAHARRLESRPVLLFRYPPLEPIVRGLPCRVLAAPDAVLRARSRAVLRLAARVRNTRQRQTTVHAQRHPYPVAVVGRQIAHIAGIVRRV